MLPCTFRLIKIFHSWREALHREAVGGQLTPPTVYAAHGCDKETHNIFGFVVNEEYFEEFRDEKFESNDLTNSIIESKKVFLVLWN